VEQDIVLTDFHLLELPLRLFKSYFSAVARLKITCRSMAIRFLRERNPDACLRPMSARAPNLRQGIGHYSSLRVYCRAEAGV
jgi:hypothetical protein